MTIARAYLDSGALKTFPDVIRKIPKAIRPTHFGPSEDKKEGRFPVPPSGAPLKHIESGYLLFAGETTYSVNPPWRGFVEIFISNEKNSLTGEDLKRALCYLIEPGLKFGFIANWEEYLHRNQHVYPLSNGKVESLIGRDLTKYLPGLYWTNVLSKDIAEKFEIREDQLPQSSTMVDFGADHLAFQLFDRPDDWPKFADQIDAFCEANEKVFSLRRIREQLDKAPNYLALSKLLSLWR